MSKSTIQAEVVSWLHNDAASTHVEEFWSRARDAISGDVYGIDLAVVDWDLAHCVEHESLWFYACLVAGSVYLRDVDVGQAAMSGYRDEVGRVGTSPGLRQVTGRMERPYGA